MPLMEGFPGTESALSLSLEQGKTRKSQLFLWYSCSNAAIRQRRLAICPENPFVIDITIVQFASDGYC